MSIEAALDALWAYQRQRAGSGSGGSVEGQQVKKAKKGKGKAANKTKEELFGSDNRCCLPGTLHRWAGG